MNPELTRNLKDEALRLAGRTVRYACGAECAIDDGLTLELPWGWVFFWTTFAFLRTGDASENLFGNAPLIVYRRTGRTEFTGTRRPITPYIRRFERAHGYRPWWKPW